MKGGNFYHLTELSYSYKRRLAVITQWIVSLHKYAVRKSFANKVINFLKGKDFDVWK